jgi:hypothetical protein
MLIEAIFLILYKIGKEWDARSHMRKHCKKYWSMFLPNTEGRYFTECTKSPEVRAKDSRYLFRKFNKEKRK